MEKSSYAQINYFQDNIANGKENEWRCRAGSRYLYICEDGLVHYCSQQRGYPAKPLAEYTRDDIRREYPDGEELRAALHGGMRPPDFVHGFLARPRRRSHRSPSHSRMPIAWYRSSSSAPHPEQ